MRELSGSQLLMVVIVEERMSGTHVLLYVYYTQDIIRIRMEAEWRILDKVDDVSKVDFKELLYNDLHPGNTMCLEASHCD